MAQDIKIAKIDNADLIKFANNSELIAETDAAQNLIIKIFKLDNGPGSAGYENGEVTHNMIIAVSEYDEYPLQNLFVVSEFYALKFADWSNATKNSITAKAEYGPAHNRKTIKLRIALDEIKIE